ncbi:MAG: thioredoxin family protein [Lachnospiraceae bacterium]|nr:thioredoxin family protein [Lachnospiraceae bacterium]
MTRFVSEEEFDQVTKEGFWIADFLTDHCGPCKMLDLVLSEIIFDNPEINLAKCDIEKSPAYVDRFGIQGTPTLLFMMNGEIKSSITGIQPRDILTEKISEAMYD